MSLLQFVRIVLFGDKMKCPFCNVIETGTGTMETMFLASKNEEVTNNADKRRGLKDFMFLLFCVNGTKLKNFLILSIFYFHFL